MTYPGHAAEVRRALSDPWQLVTALGLSKGAKRGGNYVVICCPKHGDRTPSCSVRRARDGTIAVKCWPCDWRVDALGLVAHVYQLDVRTQFKDVLTTAATLAGLHQLVDEIQSGKPVPERPMCAAPIRTEPEPEYPPADEVAALWEGAGPVDGDPQCVAHLEGRKIPPGAVTRLGLARALVLQNGLWCQLPRWARYRGDRPKSEWWPELGYRMVVPVYNHAGEMRSVRAWRVTEGSSPKRLPPSGHKANGLALANPKAIGVLRGGYASKLVIVEGEPDALVWMVKAPWLPVLGILSGSWTKEFAERIPRGSEVIVRTHTDDAGDRYAEEIKKTIADRAWVRRLERHEEIAA